MPNTLKDNDCAAHGHKKPYFFAPPEKVNQGFAAKKAKKKKAGPCCNCKIGTFTTKSCKSCFGNNTECTNCASGKCKNPPKEAKKAKTA